METRKRLLIEAMTQDGRIIDVQMIETTAILLPVIGETTRPALHVRRARVMMITRRQQRAETMAIHETASRIRA
jgi:hypothetical protein